MTVLLLRHAAAGDRARWSGDDRYRPLDERGHRQAQALVDTYAAWPVTRIVSSPYARCVGTVEPLADTLDVDVEVEDALAEGTPLDVVAALVRRLGEVPTVVCTHGDIVSSLVTDLQHRDVGIADQLRWEKGSTWVLEGTPEITRASYLPPGA